MAGCVQIVRPSLNTTPRVTTMSRLRVLIGSTQMESANRYVEDEENILNEVLASVSIS